MYEFSKHTRAALFQDLSGLGRCALSVSMPVIATLGVQPCALPTALLSAHTRYEGAILCDQTEFLKASLAHWDECGEVFEGIYTGYLASLKSAEMIASYIDAQIVRGCGFVLVDPAMADHGALYRAMPKTMPDAMRALCKRASLITPNYTEACLLTNTPYKEAPIAPCEALSLLDRLMEIGCKSALITGVRLAGDDKQAVNLLMDGEPVACAYEQLEAHYPGTGDLFASVMIASILRGDTASKAMSRATAFTWRSIKRSLALHTAVREGVSFEPILCELQSIDGQPVTPFRVAGD